jgi:farnesyl diphosphate synthase
MTSSVNAQPEIPQGLTALKHYQQRIDNFLSQKLNELEVNDPRLLEAMRYGLLIGGKRMRPYLVYITGDMLRLTLADCDAIAAALECIHAYSLIHDDLPAMDDDELRRGQPTCHIAFDEAIAILAGDSLQTLAFDILAHHSFSPYSEQQKVKLIQMLSRASGYQGMCGGQAMDLAATGQHSQLAQLEQTHRLKTGALLTAAVMMPAQCSATLTPDEMTALNSYAQCIGLAYQVQDDIIDITSSEQVLGKPKGSDLAANKTTYPALLGLTGAQEKREQLYQQALQALQALPYNSDNLSALATFIVKRSS